MDFERDTKTPKIHPTQKSVPLLERLIKIFTDPGEVVVDPVAGSGTTLLAAMNCGRVSYGLSMSFGGRIAPPWTLVKHYSAPWWTLFSLTPPLDVLSCTHGIHEKNNRL